MNSYEMLVDILGYKVQDKVTGYTGVATSSSIDLYGCLQVLVTLSVNNNGEINSRWFDFNRLIKISSDKVMEQQNKALKFDKGPAEKVAFDSMPTEY